VCDKAGNCFTTNLTSNAAKIDLTKPLVSLGVWGSTINGTSSDGTSGIDKVEIRIVKPDLSESIVTATGTTSWTHTMSDAPYGNYKIYITAIDIAGNRSDELYKDFVMSPPSQNRSTQATDGSVQGASTETLVQPKTQVSPKSIVPEVTEDELSDIQSENPIIENVEPKYGEVLGESVKEKKTNYWWWLLLIIPALIAIALITRKK
jgi:predicted phage tail protein